MSFFFKTFLALSFFGATVETLSVADMASLEKRRQSREKKAKGGDKESKKEVELIDIILPHLDQGKPALTLRPAQQEAALARAVPENLHECNNTQQGT